MNITYHERNTCWSLQHTHKRQIQATSSSHSKMADSNIYQFLLRNVLIQKHKPCYVNA